MNAKQNQSNIDNENFEVNMNQNQQKLVNHNISPTQLDGNNGDLKDKNSSSQQNKRSKQPSPFLKNRTGKLDINEGDRNAQAQNNKSHQQQRRKSQDDPDTEFVNQGFNSHQYPQDNNENMNSDLANDLNTVTDDSQPGHGGRQRMSQQDDIDENDSRFFHNQSSAKMVRKAILELYLNVKIRSQEEIGQMTEDMMEKERQKLGKVDTVDLIDYIKQSVEILMHMRIEEFEMFKSNWNAQEKLRLAQIKDEKEALKRSMRKGNNEKRFESKLFDKVKYELISNQSSQASLKPEREEEPADKDTGKEKKLDKQAEGYEKMLIKLEGDIRQHIRIEQQLKLHIEQVQQQTDEVFKDSSKKQEQIEELTHSAKKSAEAAARSEKKAQDFQVQLMEVQSKMKVDMQKLQELNVKKEKILKNQIAKLENEIKQVKLQTGNLTGQQSNFKSEYATRQNASELSDIKNDSYGIKSGNLGMVPGTATGSALQSLPSAATGARQAKDGGRGGKNLRIGTHQQCSEETLTDQTLMGSNYNYSQSAAVAGSQQAKHTGKNSSNTFIPSAGSRSRDHSLGGGNQRINTKKSHKSSKEWNQNEDQKDDKMPSISQQMAPRDTLLSNFNRSAVIQQTPNEISEMDPAGSLEKRAQSPDIVVTMAQSAGGPEAVSLQQKSFQSAQKANLMPSIYSGQFQKNSMSGRMLVQGGAQSLGAGGAGGGGPQGSSLRNQSNHNQNLQNADSLKLTQSQAKSSQQRRNISKISNENKSFQNFSQRGADGVASHSEGRANSKFVNPRRGKDSGNNVGKIMHNMSMDEGVAGASSSGPQLSQLVEPVATAAKVGSRKASKTGRRSSTTHEQSHANQYFMPGSTVGDPSASGQQHAQLSYEQKLMRAQQQILDPTSMLPINQSNSKIVNQVLENVLPNQGMPGRQGNIEGGAHPQQVAMDASVNGLMGGSGSGAVTQLPHYNNKIIINQQHYFTDSIKIYQNSQNDNNSNNYGQKQKNARVQGGAQTQQSPNSSQGNPGCVSAGIEQNGQSGRHTSMHEYLSSGMNGLNMGVGGFTQVNNGGNFQELINSSQKVSVPQGMIQRGMRGGTGNIQLINPNTQQNSKRSSLGGGANTQAGPSQNGSKMTQGDLAEQISFNQNAIKQNHQTARRQIQNSRGSRDQKRKSKHETQKISAKNVNYSIDSTKKSSRGTHGILNSSLGFVNQNTQQILISHHEQSNDNVREDGSLGTAGRGLSQSSRLQKTQGPSSKHFSFKNKQNEPLLQKLLENQQIQFGGSGGQSQSTNPAAKQHLIGTHSTGAHSRQVHSMSMASGAAASNERSDQSGRFDYNKYLREGDIAKTSQQKHSVKKTNLESGDLDYIQQSQQRYHQMTGQQIHTSLGLSSVSGVSGVSGISSAASAGNGANGVVPLASNNIRINSGSVGGAGAGIGGIKSGQVGSTQATRNQMVGLQNGKQVPGRLNNTNGQSSASRTQNQSPTRVQSNQSNYSGAGQVHQNQVRISQNKKEGATNNAINAKNRQAHGQRMPEQ